MQIQQTMSPATTPTRLTATITTLLLLIINSSHAATNSNNFIYAGCSSQTYTTNNQYDTNLNTLLTSLQTSSATTTYTNLTVGTTHGLFQCRPDLPSTTDCSSCISASISQLPTACPNSMAATLCLNGCFLRYDKTAFFGVEDKTLIYNKCGTQLDSNAASSQLAQWNQVLGYLTSGTAEMFRVNEAGGVSGVAECIGDLNLEQCQDCLTEAISILKTNCCYTSWGDVYLSSCYARYTVTVAQASSTAGNSYNVNPYNGNYYNNPGSKRMKTTTLAIIIGVIAMIGLLVIFVVLLKKYFKKEKDDHHCCHK